MDHNKWVYKYQDKSVCIDVDKDGVVIYIYLRENTPIATLVESLKKAQAEAGIQ